jgi:predicted RNase H-like nuclease (RuvC/YqgF family)
LKDGKTDKSDQLKEKLLQIENLERGIRSSENEISKLKQQISTLNSINSKVEDNYKKLLREKSEELDQNHQNSSQKAKEIQDLSDTVTALENHIL